MKKCFKYLSLILLSSMLMMPVYAKDLQCKGLSSVKIDQKIPDTVHIIVLIIQIAVPVILVIFGMIDLLKAVIAGKEDEIKKNQNVFIKRLIAAALVFFIFVIVKLVVNVVADNSNIMDCANCFINGTKDCNLVG